MGTCATVRVYDVNRMILAMYVNADGYESDTGVKLAKFCQSRPLVNGIGDSELVFNGAGCFAAQLVSHLKGDKAGLWYISGAKGERLEFNYKIICYQKEIHFISKGPGHRFSGNPAEYESWLAKVKRKNQ